mgnify:CR=1 FL=1
MFYGAAEFSRELDLILPLEEPSFESLAQRWPNFAPNPLPCRHWKARTWGAVTLFTSGAGEKAWKGSPAQTDPRQTVRATEVP